MARPAPDPELVIRAYELTHIERKSRREVATALGISVGTVQTWLREASRWLSEYEALPARVERESQDQYSSYMLARVHAEHQARDLDTETWVKLSLAILKRRADLLGADAAKRIALEGGDPTPVEPAQAEAVRKMIAAQQERRARILEERPR